MHGHDAGRDLMLQCPNCEFLRPRTWFVLSSLTTSGVMGFCIACRRIESLPKFDFGKTGEEIIAMRSRHAQRRRS
jgi:hypothetical protein